MSTSPMPRTLAVVRAVLYVKVILTLLGAPLMLIGIAVMTDDEVFQEMGLGKAAAAAFTIAYIAQAFFELYAVVTLRHGGRIRQRCVRVVVGLHLVFVLAHLLTGGVSLSDAALAVLLLVLNESRSARNWYRSGTPVAADLEAPVGEGTAVQAPTAEDPVAEDSAPGAPKDPTP